MPPKYTCEDCGVPVYPGSRRCRACCNKRRRQAAEIRHLCCDCGVKLKDPRSIRCTPCKGAEQTRIATVGREAPNPSGLCLCGCGRPAPIAKYSSIKDHCIKGLPIRYIQNHELGNPYRPLYEVDEATGCWNWLGFVDPGGYGTKWNGKTMEKAHRSTWIKLRGPIPDGLHLHHTCINRMCVNPDHLELMTPSDHSRFHRNRERRRRQKSE